VEATGIVSRGTRYEDRREWISVEIDVIEQHSSGQEEKRTSGHRKGIIHGDRWFISLSHGHSEGA
jgi:hypothetical protein